MNPSEFAFGVGIGLGATAMMDLWNLFLKRGLGIPSLDYCLLGRWVLHIPRGTVRHTRIAAAPEVPHECPAGWIAHYTIGTVLALLFLTIAPARWVTAPTLMPPLLFGMATVVFPFLVLQPALGLGIASSKTASPARARLKSLVTHVVFGIGLFLCALLGRGLVQP